MKTLTDYHSGIKHACIITHNTTALATSKHFGVVHMAQS
jgi:hypothetical protein